MKKDDAERWGQVDGERYALRWLAVNAAYDEQLPVKSEIEWKLVSETGQNETESVAHDQAIGRKIDLHKRERAWYVAAFRSKAKRAFEKAHAESHEYAT
jgi:hypothetical protein